MSVPAGTAQSSFLTSETTGLVGTLTWRLIDSTGTTVIAAGTGSITEGPSGTYRRDYSAPSTAGLYQPVWNDGADIPDAPIVVTALGGVPSGADLCTLADVQSALEIAAADTARNALIGALITSASHAIMDETDREFAPASSGVTRRFRVNGYSLNLAPYDLRSVTTFTLHPESTSPSTLTAGTDYELQPVGAPSGTYRDVRFSSYLANLLTSDTAFRMGHSLVDITGSWGFASVPVEVSRACVVTVSAWLRRDISALGMSNDFEGQSQPLPTTFGIPYDARRLLSSFYRLQSFVF